jgi:hypothetical protein
MLRTPGCARRDQRTPSLAPSLRRRRPGNHHAALALCKQCFWPTHKVLAPLAAGGIRRKHGKFRHHLGGRIQSTFSSPWPPSLRACSQHQVPHLSCAPELFNWRVSHYQRQAKHDWPWHDRRVIALADLLVQLLGDLVVLVFLAARPTRSLAAENLLLRRQLALYLERGTKPPRIDAATRITLAWLSRLCDWRSALVVVCPQTVIRWHRAGWRLLWRYKSRPGRPPIPHEL